MSLRLRGEPSLEFAFEDDALGRDLLPNASLEGFPALVQVLRKRSAWFMRLGISGAPPMIASSQPAALGVAGTLLALACV
jgi:hypothetical protein